jgi:dethiobiotin synthetase
MIVQPFDLGVPGLFVTGTDTGVGKTLVAGALAAAAHDCGVRVGVMKPVESGCQRRDGRLVPRDAIFLREMSGCGASLELVNPYALQHPLAPALAAELESVSIDLARLDLCYRTLAAEYSPVIVEGAGGLLTPLCGGLTMRDLAVMLRLPVLVVARNTLGAINHAMLTVESARRVGLDVIGIVLNRPAFTEDDATRTNATSLRRWGGAPFIGEIPFLPSLDRGTLALRGIDLASQIGASRARIQGRQARRTTGREFRRRGSRHG